MTVQDKIILAGAAGLVGQNLIVQLEQKSYRNLVAIDKHAYNLNILKQLHPDVKTIFADLADPGEWQNAFADAACVVMLQAQITGTNPASFVRNNVESTHRVLDAVRAHRVPYIVHVSSSVVISVADDDYTETKAKQEEVVRQSGVKHCILRPTLMFGWFDPKHLGWLSRFMEKTPVFPIPGHGRYPRQPLYNKDFCKMVIHCIENQPDAAIYDIVGDQQIDYVDIIRAIKRAKKLKTPVIHLPYRLFHTLLRIFAVFSRNPPFTADQLTALTAGDRFVGVNTEELFGVTQTPFEEAIRETFCDERYSNIVLKPQGSM